MLSIGSGPYFYDGLLDILKSGLNNREKIASSSSLFKEILKKATEDERQYFSGSFARLIFITDKYKLPYNLASELRHFRHIVQRLYRNPDISFSYNDILLSVKCISELTACITHEEIPLELLPFLEKVKQSGS